MAGTESKSSTRKIEKLERQKQVLLLRKAGHTHMEIAAKLGITKRRTYQLVKEAMQEYRDDIAGEVPEFRARELMRLDDLQIAVYKRIADSRDTSVDLDAVKRMLEIMERRAKLLGLDMPTKVAPTMPDGEQPLQVSGPVQVLIYMPDNGRETPALEDGSQSADGNVIEHDQNSPPSEGG